MYASTRQHDDERVRDLATQLFTERHEYLRRIARANAANPDDAEEALQQSFLAFLGHFDPDSGAPPLAWLTLTLKRECWAKHKREHWEQRASRDAHDLVEQGCSMASASRAAAPEGSIERAEHLIEARRDLARLKPAQRRALCLIALGYSYREVGEITGWSQTKINRCAAEGRAALREMAAD